MPPLRRANPTRWLAFGPSLLIFLLAGATPSHGFTNDALSLHDELLGFGFISTFVAILWVSSQRVVPIRRVTMSRPPTRGFEVVVPNELGSDR